MKITVTLTVPDTNDEGSANSDDAAEETKDDGAKESVEKDKEETSKRHHGSSTTKSSRYENQKRRDWNTFVQYLKNHRPPLSLSLCTGAHVLEFLSYLDQFGKTKVHTPICPSYGHPNPPAPCPCPLRQAWGSVDALIGRLRAAFEENGGKPDRNPFGARVVTLYLRGLRDLQSKARGINYEKKKKKMKRPQQQLPMQLPLHHHRHQNAGLPGDETVQEGKMVKAISSSEVVQEGENGGYINKEKNKPGRKRVNADNKLVSENKSKSDVLRNTKIRKIKYNEHKGSQVYQRDP